MTTSDHNVNENRVILHCDCGSEDLVFEYDKWGPEDKFDNLSFSIRDSYLYDLNNTIYGRLNRALKILFGKPIYYADVDIVGKEKVVKFLEDCLRVCKGEEQ